MKILLVTFFLFFTGSFFGQKSYSFDYLIEYEYKRDANTPSKTVFLLTNSEDNSYHIIARENNSATLDIYFRDVKGLYSSSVVHRKGFFIAENIDLPCESVRYQKDKVDLKRYEFAVNPDTLIANVLYKKYSMKYGKEREALRYKTGKSYYIIENETDFHKPLLIFSTVFDVSVTSEIFPNGIAKEIYNTSKFGLKSHYKLVKYTKVNKAIAFPNCPKIQP